MTHPEPESPRDRAAAYALGALAPEEAREFETFLAGSPDAQREVAEFREVMALLALAGDQAGPGPGLQERAPAPGPGLQERVLAPDPDVRERVLMRVGQEKDRSIRPGSTKFRGSPVLWGALAASLIVVAGLGFAAFDLRRELADVEAALTRDRRTLAEARQRLAEREATLNAILTPDVQMVQLTASGDPDPGIQLFWDRQSHRAILHGFRLKPVPPDRAYQLWFIRDGKPVPSVTFKPEPTGQAKVEQVPVPAEGKLTAAAVTIEPESGSQQPTSPIVLVGSLERS